LILYLLGEVEFGVETLCAYFSPCQQVYICQISYFFKKNF
jgi:hypothetical protein